MNPLLVIILIIGIINGIYYGQKYPMEAFVIVGATLFTVFSIRSTIRSNKSYRSLPTVREYKTKHGSQIKGGGMVCTYCGSRSIRNWGRSSANDSERIFICNHCGETLYRNG